MNKNQYVAPLMFIGAMFFICGFALGINPILIPILKQSLEVSSFESYMVVFASFVPFLIWGYPAQEMIAHVGYKRTMAFSFLCFALSFGGYVLAAWQGCFWLFLLASFVSGSANAFLQASINPYVTFLGPLDSAAKRISIMGICNKIAWPLPSLFVVWLVGKQTNLLLVQDLFMPFYVMIALVLALAVLCVLFPLPDIKSEGSVTADASSESESEDGPSSIWQVPHLLLGCLALFLYVGVETVSLSTAVDYAVSLGLANADVYAWIAPVGMVIGYICGVVFIPRYLSQSKALSICSVVAILGSVLLPTLPAHISIYAIFLLALGCSLMWPALWPLAMSDLGKLSKAGASLLTMAIAGGAVVPTLFGLLNDANMSVQPSYWICLPCFLFIFYYGTWGWKIRRQAK